MICTYNLMQGINIWNSNPTLIQYYICIDFYEKFPPTLAFQTPFLFETQEYLLIVLRHIFSTWSGQSGIWHWESKQFEAFSIWFVRPFLSVTSVMVVNFPLQSQFISSLNSVFVSDWSQSCFQQFFPLNPVRKMITELFTLNTYHKTKSFSSFILRFRILLFILWMIIIWYVPSYNKQSKVVLLIKTLDGLILWNRILGLFELLSHVLDYISKLKTRILSQRIYHKYLHK